MGVLGSLNYGDHLNLRNISNHKLSSTALYDPLNFRDYVTHQNIKRSLVQISSALGAFKLPLVMPSNRL